MSYPYKAVALKKYKSPHKEVSETGAPAKGRGEGEEG